MPMPFEKTYFYIIILVKFRYGKPFQALSSFQVYREERTEK